MPNYFRRPDQQEFADVDQEDRPMAVNTSRGGSLIATYDRDNARNPIVTSIQKDQGFYNNDNKNRYEYKPQIPSSNSQQLQQQQSHYQQPSHNYYPSPKQLQKHPYLHQPGQKSHRGPQDYLFWSIANVFIFVILALPALFFSVQTREMKKSGNIQKAKIYSKRSLILNIIASVLGLLAITLAVIFRFALYHLFVQNDVQSQNVPMTSG